MHSIRIATHELTRIFSDRKIRVAAVVIMLVPLLYGALYLWAFWDPYARLNHLPVALVNQDRPATVDGETINAGSELVDTLLDKGTLEWHQVSEPTAEKGLADGSYYMALRIPAGFSASLATANTDSPHRARLIFSANESANLLASQIGERVFSEVRMAISSAVSENYLDKIFLGFDDLGVKLTDAADGATDLAEGLEDAQSGAASLAGGTNVAHDGASRLSVGSAKLVSGTKTLTKGTSDLVEGTTVLASGLRTASAGSAALASGSGQAAAGANGLASGAGSIDTGAEKLSASARELAAVASQVDEGVGQLVGEIDGALSASSQIAAGTAGTVMALNAYMSAHPEATEDAAFATALATAQATDVGADQLHGGLVTGITQAKALAAGAHAVSAGSDLLADGAESLASATGQLTQGADSLASAASRLASGTRSLATGVAAAKTGALKLTAGTAKLDAGAQELNEGVRTAASAAARLSSGLGRLESGSTDLAEGLEPAVTGSLELSNGLTAGIEDIPAYSDSVRVSNARMMSDPVTLTERKISPVPDYGTGFSPYFIPLALWVGALMTFFIVHPLPLKALEDKLPAPLVALSGFWPAALLAVAQSIIMLSVLRLGLGLDPRTVPGLYLFTALSAIVFVALLQWLSSSFGAAGKFFAIVLLMLQLTSSAGTFPMQIIPPFFQAIAPFLPMTYVVAGLRQAISGGDMTALWHNATILGGFGLGGLILSSVTSYLARSWDAERLSPGLEL